MKDLTRGTAGSSAGDRASLRASSPFPRSGAGSNGTSSNSPSTSNTAVPETSLQRICRHLPGVIYQFSWRTDGSITCSFVSPGCRTLFDLDPIDVIRDASIVISLIHPEDLPSFNRSVALSVKTLQVWNWEGRIVTPGGATKWIQAAAHLERGTNGEVLWEGMAMEISPSRGIQPPAPAFPAELTLQQMPDPVFVRDTRQRWLFANQAFCDLFNCTQEDLLSGGWDGTFPTPIATGITEGEQCLHAETGTPRQVRVRQHMVVSEAGDRFWVGSVQDITANKQEVAQWRSAWEALQRVVDGIPAALFWKDRDSTYQGCNRSYAKVIGIKHPDDLRGSSDYDLSWRREEADWLREQDKTVMQDNTAASDIIELPNPGKPTTSWFHNRRLPLQDAEGNIVGVLGMLEDITPLHQYLLDRWQQKPGTIRPPSPPPSTPVAPHRAQPQMPHNLAVCMDAMAYQNFFERTNLGFFLCRLEGTLVAANHTYAALLGRTVPELLALGYWEITPDTYVDAELAYGAQLKQNGFAGPYEKEYIHKQGHLVAVRLWGVMVERDGEQLVWSWVEPQADMDAKDGGDRLETLQRNLSVLQQERYLYQTMLDAAPLAIALKNTHHQIVKVNDLAARVFTVGDSSDPSPADVEVLRSGEMQTGAIERWQTKSDESLWVEVRRMPWRYPNGRLGGAIVFAAPIERPSDASLTPANDPIAAQLMTVLQETPDFVGIADALGYFRYINASGRQTIGIDLQEDVTALRLIDIMGKSFTQQTLNQLLFAAMEKGWWHGDSTLQNRDGEEVPVSQVLMVHKSDTGEVDFLSTIARSLETSMTTWQERKRAIAYGDNALSLLNAALDATADAILVVDAHGRVAKWNQKFIDLWGIPQFLLTSRNDSQILAFMLRQLLDPHAFIAQLRDLKTNPEVESCDILKLKDDRVLERYSRPQRVGDRVVGRVWSFRDITDTLSAEEALRESEAKFRKQAMQLQKTLTELQQTQSHLIQSEKMSSLGQMVAGIAHEINNPVNFIHGNLTYLAEYVENLLELLQLYQTTFSKPSSDIEEKLEEIDLNFLLEDLPRILESMQMGTERIQGIVQSLRTFSRLDEAEIKIVDIHAGIESTLLILENRLKETARRPAIQIIKNYSALPKVACYPGQLNQVLMNLLANAIDALDEAGEKSPEKPTEKSTEKSSEPPTILLETAIAPSGNILISVKDNGPGIPLEVQQRLFDPFFTTKPVGKGTGLGLSISYQIVVERHQGQLRCTSAPGQGTEFTIEIPAKISN